VRWTLPARTSARTVAGLTAPWPDGRWFPMADALALGLPAPLRKRLVAAAAPSPRRAGRGLG
jgi:A/G-specific adenine glycosylase